MAPYVIAALPEKVQANENEKIDLECQIGGIPEPTISW